MRTSANSGHFVLVLKWLFRDEDVVLLRWAYKWSRELARRMDSYRGEYAPAHPGFAEGSEAKCGEAQGPVNIAAREIQCVVAK